jgi:anti-anti-sigma factor
MVRAYRHLDVEHHEDIFCVRLRQRRLDEDALYELGEELNALVDQDGCRKMILSLGPKAPECLYSILLGQLVATQRRLHEQDGALLIVDANPDTVAIFEACRLKDLFAFAADRKAAIKALST